MTAKALEFIGACVSCERSQGGDNGRLGVEINMCFHASYMGEMVCGTCARRLAAAIQRAILDGEDKQKCGYEYRNDRWRKKWRKKKP